MRTFKTLLSRTKNQKETLEIDCAAMQHDIKNALHSAQIGAGKVIKPRLNIAVKETKKCKISK